MWLGIFWPLILGQKVVGFRDAANLYYPLFEWIDKQLGQGILPIWNPYCNFGMPVIHDGSSSIFYPGKVIFFLRALPYPARYGLYLSIHILIAAAGTYWFSRTLRTKRSGATLAAISYAFGGAVLFQVVNAPFVISAAWLPFALCCVWKTFRERRTKWAIWTALFCSLMILGGDPQMCYHVGLIMLAFTIQFTWRNWRRLRSQPATQTSSRPSVFKSAASAGMWLGVTVAVTFCLSAVQILPSYVWAKQSIRSQAEHPRSLSEWIFSEQGQQDETDRSESWQAFLTTVFNEAPDTVHQNHAYQFSQPPWTMAELVWPNVSGRAYPIHQRWVDGLPGAERMWTPSLYAGSFVFVLALLAMNPLSASRKRAWLARLFLFFAIGSLGWYGLAWLGQELSLIDPDSKLASPVGGLYWLMAVVLPKYITFRYPAKLFTIAALAISLLAGGQLGRLLRAPNESCALRRICVSIGIGSVLILLFSDSIARVGKGISSPLFGPFDFLGCQTSLHISAVTTAMVLLACCGLVRWGAKYKRCAAALIVGICGGEIWLANAWLVPSVNTSVFQASTSWDGLSTVDKWTARHDGQSSKPGDSRAYVSEPQRIATPIQNAVPDGLPNEFYNRSSQNRLAEIVRWQREMLAPKFHLQHDLHLFNSFASLEPVLPVMPALGQPVVSDQNQQAFSVSETPAQVDFYRELFIKRPDAHPNATTHVRLFRLKRYILQLETKTAQEPVTVMVQAIPGWRVTAQSNTTGEKIELDVSTTAATHNRPASDQYGIHFQLPDPDAYTVAVTYTPSELVIGVWTSAISWGLLILFSFVVLRRSR